MTARFLLGIVVLLAGTSCGEKHAHECVVDATIDGTPISFSSNTDAEAGYLTGINDTMLLVNGRSTTSGRISIFVRHPENGLTIAFPTTSGSSVYYDDAALGQHEMTPGTLTLTSFAFHGVARGSFAGGSGTGVITDGTFDCPLP